MRLVTSDIASLEVEDAYNEGYEGSIKITFKEKHGLPDFYGNAALTLCGPGFAEVPSTEMVVYNYQFVVVDDYSIEVNAPLAWWNNAIAEGLNKLAFTTPFLYIPHGSSPLIGM